MPGDRPLVDGLGSVAFISVLLALLEGIFSLAKDCFLLLVPYNQVQFVTCYLERR